MAKLYLLLNDYTEKLDEDDDIGGTLYKTLDDIKGWIDADSEYAVLEIDTDKLMFVELKSALVVKPRKAKKEAKK